MNNLLSGKLTSRGNLNGNVNTIVYAHNYNDLSNKPQINNVTLQGNKTASELGLATPSDIPVTSVNDQTGDVVLSGSDIDYSVGMSLNAKIDDLEAQIQGSGVQSVNGMTGNVTLTSNDINYSTGVTIKNKIDAVEGEIPEVYVSSVNGNSGAVTLTGSDIIYSGVQSVNGAIDSLSEDLSGLTGEDIPMSGTDSTPVATAVGDLSDLTTSVTSSLVGALNEVNASSTASVTPISVTVNSVINNNITKIGKVVHIEYSFSLKAMSGTIQNKTWGTIPEGYRPTSEVIFNAYYISDYANNVETKAILISASSSGSITTPNNGANGTLSNPTNNSRIYMSATYIVS